MEFTITLPDTIGRRISEEGGDVAELVSLGLRQLDARKAATYDGVADLLDQLAGLPSPSEVMALQPSELLQVRIRELLEKNRDGGLSEEEEEEWQRFEHLEHVVRKAKARAALMLSDAA